MAVEISLKTLLNVCQPLTLLYVEDDEQARETTQSIFSNLFGMLHVATNGEEGVELFHAHAKKIDLIITDITMPKMNGIEMIGAIRTTHPDIPIVVITAHSEYAFFAQTVELGVDAYLLKPLKQAQLFKTLFKIAEKIQLKHNLLKNLSLLKQYQEITNKSSIVSKANPSGIITYVNEKFCQISGYKAEELVGKPHNIIRHPDMPASTFRDMWHIIKEEKKLWQGIVKNRAKNGDAYYVKTTIQPILNDEGEVEEFIALRHDITAIMSDRKQLFDFLGSNHLSVLILVQIEDYDTLEKFYDKISVQKIEESFGRVLLYMMPNPWGFQRVYHLENGLYAFAIDRRNCRASAEEIESVLEEFLARVKEHVIKVDEIEYDISALCSFTYGVYKIFEDAKIGIEKAIEEKRHIVYADGLSGLEHEAALKNIETIHTIKAAIDQQKVISYFQPIVNNTTLEVEKFESLVRIIDENGKLLSPFHFLEVAKKGRYYAKITKIVLENSFLALTKTDKAISINLSVYDIEREDIREEIFALLERYKEENHRIVFEILESESVKAFEMIEQFITIIKARGVKIAIDDFGTGYSNFERLLKYQPDILKIDGGLIKHLDHNRLNRNIVETIVSFAQKQQMQTIAEFVENETIFKIVQSLGIDYSQGYAFGKPEVFD